MSGRSMLVGAITAIAVTFATPAAAGMKAGEAVGLCVSKTYGCSYFVSGSGDDQTVSICVGEKAGPTVNGQPTTTCGSTITCTGGKDCVCTDCSPPPERTNPTDRGRMGKVDDVLRVLQSAPTGPAKSKSESAFAPAGVKTTSPGEKQGATVKRGSALPAGPPSSGLLDDRSLPSASQKPGAARGAKAVKDTTPTIVSPNVQVK
jgi:hypothetical protein